jgi:hypothetical protein
MKGNKDMADTKPAAPWLARLHRFAGQLPRKDAAQLAKDLEALKEKIEEVVEVLDDAVEHLNVWADEDVTRAEQADGRLPRRRGKASEVDNNIRMPARRGTRQMTVHERDGIRLEFAGERAVLTIDGRFASNGTRNWSDDDSEERRVFVAIANALSYADSYRPNPEFVDVELMKASRARLVQFRNDV